MANVLKETVRGIDKVAIEDEFLENREIFLVDEVNDASSNELIKQLLYLERRDNTAQITLYINSPGGNVISGLAVYDCMRLMKSPVKTVCIGSAASMGAILFLAGDEREMLPHTRLMIHDPSFGRLDVSGKKPHELQQEVDSLSKVKETLAQIISEKTGKPLEEIYKVTANDTYFDAKEAMEFGLATAVCKGV